MTVQDTLPDTLSGLLRVAVNDYLSCLQDPHYGINMLQWHEPGKDVCYVCLAGAVMARSLGTGREESKAPNDFLRSVFWKLQALDHLREGLIHAAASVLKLEDRPHGPSVNRVLNNKYGNKRFPNPEEFTRDMLTLANRLEEAGF